MVKRSTPMQSSDRAIRLRGVRVHNLQNVDLDIPLDAITVITDAMHPEEVIDHIVQLVRHRQNEIGPR